MTNREMVQGIDLTGQVAVVTGGGRGIGRAIAQALANAGAAVAVVARSPDQLAETVALIEGAGGRGIAVTADVTDQQAVEKMANEVEQQLGRVNLLINNAGRWLLLGETCVADAGEWWREVEVNLRGPYLCTRAMLPGMISRRRGRIINLASGAGIAGWPYFSAYIAGKTALIRLSESLAVETEEHNISVFAINPGMVRTRMQTYWLDPATKPPPPASKVWDFSCQVFEDGLDTPVEQPVQLMLYLASGRADELSGCYVSVDDDVAEMVRRAQEIQKGELHTLRVRRAQEIQEGELHTLGFRT